MAENIADSPHTMRVTVQIERDMVHVAEAHAGIAQAKGNRLRGKSCPMLDPAKPLFFGRRHQHAVAYEGIDQSAWKALIPRIIIAHIRIHSRPWFLARYKLDGCSFCHLEGSRKAGLDEQNQAVGSVRYLWGGALSCRDELGVERPDAGLNAGAAPVRDKVGGK